MTTLAPMTWRLLGRGLAGTLSLLLGVWIFEAIQSPIAASLGGPEGLNPFLEALPPAFQAVMKTRPEFIMLSGLAGYLSIGFTHPLFLLLTSSAIVGFAARSLAGEMERGTILIALSRPISRDRVYAARVAGLLVITILFAASGPLGLLAGLTISRPEGTIEYRHLIPTAVAAWLLLWAIGGLTLLGSAAADTTGRAVGWATAWISLSYFIDYFATLWNPLDRVAPVSIFHYYDPTRALVNGEIATQDIVALSLAGAAGLLGGLLIFRRRDLPA